MKKIFAIIMTICLMTTALCLSALPVSAGGDFKLVVQGRGYDGRYWLIDTYEDFEKGWNEAVYYATHLDEAWDNCNYYYETEEERAEVEGLTRILVEVCLDWDADSNGSFGKGIGFKDGAIFVPEFAKMDINLCRHIINNGGSGKNAIHIDAGAQANIYSGTVVGGIYVNQHADARINVSTDSGLCPCAVGDDHVAALLHGDAGGGKLGGHAAGAPPGACAAGHLQDLRRQLCHLMEELCLGMGPGIGVIQAVDVAEQNQQVCLAQLRYKSGEGVVVAQHLVVARLDLGGGDGVVFVHHRDDAHLQQGGEGIGKMLRTLRFIHVVAGQQDLGHGAVIFGEKFVVNVHHAALAHGSGRLLHAQLLRTLGQAQLFRAHGNGAGGDQYDFVSHSLQIRKGSGQMVHAAQIQIAGLMGQSGGTNLHDNTLFLFQCGVLPVSWFIFTV